MCLKYVFFFLVYEYLEYASHLSLTQKLLIYVCLYKWIIELEKSQIIPYILRIIVNTFKKF